MTNAMEFISIQKLSTIGRTLKHGATFASGHYNPAKRQNETTVTSFLLRKISVAHR